MPAKLSNSALREIEPLSADELIGPAVKRLIESDLPGLPAVESDGSFAGIFGEREFMTALFPGYVGELGSSAMIKRSIDVVIERRETCTGEPIRRYLTTDHVVVEDDYSDTRMAELFLHHRVLVIPIATAGNVHAVVTRGDFFRELAGKLLTASS